MMDLAIEKIQIYPCNIRKDIEVNFTHLDLVTLNTFVRSVELGSLTNGADAVSLSLSTVSKRISQLESLTQLTLLDRSKQGVSLTPAGQALYRHALQIRSNAEQLCRTVQDFQRGARHHLRVWANTSAVTGFLPTFLGKFMEAHPDLSVDLEEANSEPVVKAVESRIADFGIFATNVDPGTLEFEVCDQDCLVVVASKKHHMSSRKTLQFSELLDSDHIGLNSTSAIAQEINRQAARLGKTVRLRIQVRSFDAICKMIALNLGIGILPRASANVHAKSMDLKIIPLLDGWACDRQLRVGWRHDRETNRYADDFLTRILQHHETP